MYTFDPIVRVLAGLLTPTIAVIATYIAYQQHRTNQLKVRADLYDRRMKVFNGLMELLAHIGADADTDLEHLRMFLRSTNESYFLFGEEIPKYLNSIYDAGVELRHQNKRLFSNQLSVGAERTALADENGELLKWFADQYEQSRIKFAKYLRLT